MYTMCTKEELTHLSTYAKKSLLQNAFCNIFIYKVLLSYFVVIDVDFHY